jgi:hypothetical protein
VDAGGGLRPDWARALRRRPLRTRRVAPETTERPEWAEAIRRLAGALPAARQPIALAALVVGP